MITYRINFCIWGLRHMYDIIWVIHHWMNFNLILLNILYKAYDMLHILKFWAPTSHKACIASTVWTLARKAGASLCLKSRGFCNANLSAVASIRIPQLKYIFHTVMFLSSIVRTRSKLAVTVIFVIKMTYLWLSFCRGMSSRNSGPFIIGHSCSSKLRPISALINSLTFEQ